MKEVFILLFSIFIAQGTVNANVISDNLEEKQTLYNTIKFDLLKQTEKLNESYKEHLYNVFFYEINENAFNKIQKEQPEIIEFDLQRGNENLTLQLYKNNNFAPSYFLNSNKGTIKSKNENLVYYHGVIKNAANTLVAASFTNFGLRMLIADEKGNFDFNQYNDNIYEGHFLKDVKNPKPIPCKANFDNETTESFDIGNLANAKQQMTGNCIEIFFEVDYHTYNTFGSNNITVENWVGNLFNEVSILYANENIPVSISEIFVWQSVDPYANFNDAGDVLSEFGQNRQNNYNGRLAHFLTRRSLGGGVAWLNTLCYVQNNGGSYGPFAVSTGLSSNVVPFPNYSWSVMVIAHELGHNFGSPHTHACSWTIGGISNQRIDDCGNLSSSSTPSCFSAPSIIPSNGGTIMSYCHLNSVGISFTEGFGTLPSALLLNNFANASCSTGNCSGCVIYNSNHTIGTCNDNESANDGSDDFYTITVNPSGNNLSSDFSITTLSNFYSNLNVNYGSSFSFNLPAGQNDIVTLTDNVEGCNFNINITAPEVCSCNNFPGILPNQPVSICNGGFKSLSVAGTPTLEFGSQLYYVISSSPTLTSSSIVYTSTINFILNNSFFATGTYYLFAVAAKNLDANGYPILNDNCTAISNAQQLNFLDDIEVSVSNICDSAQNKIDLFINANGGNGDFGGNYTFINNLTNDTIGNALLNENITLTNFGYGFLYDINVVDDSGCIKNITDILTCGSCSNDVGNLPTTSMQNICFEDTFATSLVTNSNIELSSTLYYVLSNSTTLTASSIKSINTDGVFVNDNASNTGLNYIFAIAAEVVLNGMPDLNDNCTSISTEYQSINFLEEININFNVGCNPISLITSFSFSVSGGFSEFNNMPYNITGTYNGTLFANQIISTASQNFYNSFNISAADAFGCQAQKESIFTCGNCNSDAGNVTDTLQTLCFNEAYQAINNGTPNLTNGTSLVYVLSKFPFVINSSIVQANTTGLFKNNGFLATNQNYFLFAVAANTFDTKGYPDMNEICTTVSSNFTQLFYNDSLQLNVFENCVDSLNSLEISYFISGGNNQYTGNSYNYYSTFGDGILQTGNFQSISATTGNGFYNYFIIAEDDNNCTQSYSTLLTCTNNFTCNDSLTLNLYPINNGDYKANNWIKSNGIIMQYDSVNINAGNYILIENGFICDKEADLHLYIDDCY